MKVKKMSLREALEIMLATAKGRLALAIERGNEWNINHYEKDVNFIIKELEII